MPAVPPPQPNDAELVGGLLQRGVDVAYQPIIDLATDQLVGWEALLRGQVPELGTISPESVVGSASRAGELDRVMRQVAEQAITAATVASLMTGRRLTVSVNVEPAQVCVDSPFLRWLVDRSTGCPADLVVEITERDGGTPWGEDQDAALDLLRAGGVAIAVDDLCAGDPRTAMLARHSWAWVKLDRSYLDDVPRREPALREVVAMVHGLSAAVVVEGIETQEHLDLARAAGADLGQGHLLGVPMPVDEVLPHLGDA